MPEIWVFMSEIFRNSQNVHEDSIITITYNNHDQSSSWLSQKPWLESLAMSDQTVRDGGHQLIICEIVMQGSSR